MQRGCSPGDRIRDKATLRWCSAYTCSVGLQCTYNSIEEFVSDGWALLILLELLTDNHLFPASMMSAGRPPLGSLQALNNIYEAISVLNERYGFTLWGITAIGLFQREPKQTRSLLYHLLKRTGDGIVWDEREIFLSCILTPSELLDYESPESWIDCDDRVLGALLHYMLPSFSYHNMTFVPDSKLENLRHIFQEAERHLSIPPPSTEELEDEARSYKALRDYVQAFATKSEDWEKNTDYGTINRWVDEINRRRSIEIIPVMSSPYSLPAELWKVIFYNVKDTRTGFPLCCVCKGFLSIIPALSPLSLTEYFQLKRDFQICDRYGTGKVNFELQVKRNNPKRERWIVSRWKIATPQLCGDARPGGNNLMDWPRYLTEFLDIICPKEEAVTKAFQELMQLPHSLTEILYNKLSGLNETWILHKLHQIEVQGEDKERATRLVDWVKEMQRTYFPNAFIVNE